MNNLEIILQILFKKVPAQAVIEEKLDFKRFSEQEFLKMAVSYIPNYSENEAENILSYYIDTFREQAHLEGRCASNTLNVFDALFYYANDCLTMQNNEVLCKYNKLIYWRQMTIEVSEDLIVSAYFARKESVDSMMKRGFSWKRVIGHNNVQLNLLVERGISENHFHLSGSSPIFHISWLSLMNNVVSSKMAGFLKGYDEERRYMNVMYSNDYKEKSFYHRYLQAALIRLLLYSKISGKRIEIRENMVFSKEIKNLIYLPEYVVNGKLKEVSIKWFRDEIRVRGFSGEYTLWEFFILCYGEGKEYSNKKLLEELSENSVYREILFSDLRYYRLDESEIIKIIQYYNSAITVKQLLLVLFEGLGKVKMKDIPLSVVDYHTYVGLWEKKTREDIHGLLKHPKEIENYLDEIQTTIDVLRFPPEEEIRYQEQELDYLLREVDKNCGEREEPYFIFSGERWLIYTMLSHIYTCSREYEGYYNLFYAYILIKESIRSEIVQSNKNVGFRNFQVYQSRKMDLIEDEIYKNISTKSALKESLITENIRTLELRISPLDSAEAIKKQINQMDEMIDPDSICRHQFFYTLHFIKEKDVMDIEDSVKLMECRHIEKRNQLKKQAAAIVNVRSLYPETGKRILGIDAAANEIGCRPEVFGVVFRYLKGQTIISDSPEEQYQQPQIRATYHVGEDFLDLADGLRAIDEAMMFLNLNCGDRLGHALALGIDVKSWYQSKNYRIALPQQDYLDNIVWIYHKLCEYNIEGFENLRADIQRDFDDYLGKIYRVNMDMSDMNRIIQRAKRETRMSGTAQKIKLEFDMNDYYHAWQLRGDDPMLYKMGYFDEFDYLTNRQEYRINMMIKDDIRYIPDVMLLYYYYHFNGGVRREGEKKVQIKIKAEYIKAVQAIQREMQREISRKGIGIETNPSSNFMIGTFKKYEDHPIMTFYNKGLTIDSGKLSECAQISVSINTDDQGVFSTSLENEYALLACALEKVRDEQEHHVYNRAMIYEWLDNIRIMGNEQSFGTKEYEKAMENRKKNVHEEKY